MEESIKDAGRIWKDFKNRINTDAKFRNMSVEDQLSFYQKNYRQFMCSFPIVLRYMVQLKLYSKKAFTKYLNKVKQSPYRSELEYCERQADYVKFLYMETSTTHNMKKAQEIWKQTYDMLADEVKYFKQAEEAVKKKMEKNNQANNMEKREELKSLLLNELRRSEEHP